MAPPQDEKRPVVVETVTQLSPITIQVDDKVYDANSLAKTHPGGELFVNVFAGRDATEAFLSYHRKRFPHDKVKDALIGQAQPAKKSQDEDYLELCKLVEEVLPRSKAYAPPIYWVKLAVLLISALALEWHIHSTRSYFWYLTAPLGLLFAWIGMNIQHDANHGSLSKYAIVNRLCGLTQNWIGGSALDWIHQHDVQHHVFPNNVDSDPDIVGNDFLRLNPIKPRSPVMVMQGLYIFFMFALFGLSYILFSLKHNLDGFHFVRYSKLVDGNRVFEEFTILFFLFRWLVLPFILVPAWSTLFNVLPVFIVGGYYLSFFFVISHNFEGALFYRSETDKDVGESFLRKQVMTGSNVGGSFLAFINGGLNYQIEHHLFPRIQHSHYPLIAPVVRAYCEKKGIVYRHFPTVMDNVMSCVRHLNTLGGGDERSLNYHPAGTDKKSVSSK